LPVTPLGSDIDHFNRTNNAVYVQWCERVGWAHSEALGLCLADYQRLDRTMVIRHGEPDFCEVYLPAIASGAASM